MCALDCRCLVFVLTCTRRLEIRFFKSLLYAVVAHVLMTILVFWKRWSHNASLFAFMGAMHGFFFISQYDLRWTGQPVLIFNQYGVPTPSIQSTQIDSALYE